MDKAKRSMRELKHEYVTSDISIRKLAKKHGVSLSSLEDACKREGWVRGRQERGKSVAEKALNKAVDEQATHLAKCVSTTDTLGDKLANLIISIDPLEKDARKDAAMLTRAWKDYLSANTLVRGLMTPLEAAQLELARERANNDKRRLEHDLGDGSDNNIKLHLGKELEEFAE